MWVMRETHTKMGIAPNTGDESFGEEWAAETKRLSNRSSRIRPAKRPFLYKKGVLMFDSLSTSPSSFLRPSLSSHRPIAMSQPSNNTVRPSPSRAQFPPSHPSRQGGISVFSNSEMGPKVTRGINNAFPSAANGVGAYPSNYEVSLRLTSVL